MSNSKMRSFNIRKIVQHKKYTRIISIDGQEWLVKDLTLYHLDCRNSRGNVSWHKQRDIKSFTDALSYIKNHTYKFKSTRLSSVDKMFSLIK